MGIRALLAKIHSKLTGRRSFVGDSVYNSVTAFVDDDFELSVARDTAWYLLGEWGKLGKCRLLSVDEKKCLYSTERRDDNRELIRFDGKFIQE